jgi:hypothetical protein
MPDGTHRLLNAADWDAEAVGDDFRDYVTHRPPDARCRVRRPRPHPSAFPADGSSTGRSVERITRAIAS